jgi:dethiobiotin synthetase
MSGLFVTATGTDIGKTFVTAGLARYLRSTGCIVHALKPVLTGFDENDWQISDPAVLLDALGGPVTLQDIERISPWRFAAPVSPDLAAQREGRAIAFEEVVAFCRAEIDRHPGTVLIEGIGGIMVPLDVHHTVLDWMAALRAPIILVAGSYVGTISHTLTALEALTRRSLDVRAVAVSESAGSAASLAETLSTISRFAAEVEVLGIPRLARGAADYEVFARLAMSGDR